MHWPSGKHARASIVQNSHLPTTWESGSGPKLRLSITCGGARLSLSASTQQWPCTGQRATSRQGSTVSSSPGSIHATQHAQHAQHARCSMHSMHSMHGTACTACTAQRGRARLGHHKALLVLLALPSHQLVAGHRRHPPHHRVLQLLRPQRGRGRAQAAAARRARHCCRGEGGGEGDHVSREDRALAGAGQQADQQAFHRVWLAAAAGRQAGQEWHEAHCGQCSRRLAAAAVACRHVAASLPPQPLSIARTWRPWG